MEIIRKRLEAAQVYPANLRYDEATDTVQYSPDGGETWIDSPENDPRQVNHYPPIDTADPRCDAAARMVALIQQLEAQLEASLLASAFGAEVATLILLILAFIPLIGVLTAVIIGLYAQLVPLGYAAVHAAFDGFDWDDLTCKIYAALGVNGVMNENGLAQLQAGIASYTSNQQTVLLGILSIVGFGGLNDAASTRGETGDCSACPTTWQHTIYGEDTAYWNWLYDYFYRCDNGQASGVGGQYGTLVTISDHQRWRSVLRSGNLATLHLQGQIYIPTETTLTRVVFGFTQEAGANMDGSWKVFRVNNITRCFPGAFYTGFNDTGTISLTNQMVTWRIEIITANPTFTQYRVSDVTFYGTGVNPFVS